MKIQDALARHSYPGANVLASGQGGAPPTAGVGTADISVRYAHHEHMCRYEVLRAVIIDDVLTQWYELVVLRRTRFGRLVLEGCQLFPPNALPGDLQPFSIRCEPSGGNGTVFAVVIDEPPRNFRLVSLESANLAPGHYKLSAELLGPALSTFMASLRSYVPESRSWRDLVAAIPARIEMYRPAHPDPRSRGQRHRRPGSGTHIWGRTTH